MCGVVIWLNANYFRSSEQWQMSEDKTHTDRTGPQDKEWADGMLSWCITSIFSQEPHTHKPADMYCFFVFLFFSFRRFFLQYLQSWFSVALCSETLIQCHADIHVANTKIDWIWHFTSLCLQQWCHCGRIACFVFKRTTTCFTPFAQWHGYRQTKLSKIFFPQQTTGTFKWVSHIFKCLMLPCASQQM